MKNILSKRTFIVLPLFLFSLHPLWGQKSNFKNDICIPGKLYMLSDIRNDVFVEALIKRWRPYNDFVRFSGDCVYSRKLNRVASVDTPVDGSNMKIELVNSDEFEIIKEKAISICVGKKGIGTQEVTVQILGDSFVNGAFFRDALLSKNYIPGIKLVGLRNIKNEEGQYDEGRGGWTVKKYFEIPKGEMTSYHGYMQPVGEYRYWGSCEFWKNCYKVINGELTDTEIVYNCGRYDQCITKFDKETGYLAAPKKNDLMYDNARGSYMVYTGKKWKNVEVDERKWAFNYRKYLDMWNLDAPKFFAQMLGLNDYRDSLTADYREWNKKIAEMKESYYKAVPDGKFIILIPCTTCGSLNNIRGDFTLRQNASMWQLRKNIIDTFDGRESEGYYVVDIGITIDNEKGTTGIVTEYRPEIPIHILIIRQWEFLLLPLFNIIENFKITMMANTFDDIITCSYKEYHQIILNYITYRITHRCEAEDLAQDVFVRLLDYKQMLRPDTVKYFLFTIARNIVTDYLRRYYKKQEVNNYIYDMIPSFTNETEEKIIADDLCKTEQRILAVFPVQRRTVYALSRYEEKDTEEIANMLNLSQRTVDYHLFLGRRDMRRYMKNCI